MNIMLSAEELLGISLDRAKRLEGLRGSKKV